MDATESASSGADVRLADRVVLHDGAALLRAEPLTIRTPEQQWAYAASFPVAGESASGWTVRVELHAEEGEIGVGLLAEGGRSFVAEESAAPGDGRFSIELRAAPLERIERVIIRNVAPGQQASSVTIHGLSISNSDAAATTDAVVRLSSSVFSRFTPFDGRVPAGFWVNWMGVLTRDYVWPFSPEVMKSYSTERNQRCGYPTSDEHVLDWEPLLRAVLTARDEFTMIALGAGWGRWLSAAAAACRQVGRTFRLTGVEAERDHFRWMRTHLEENGIAPDRVRLIEAAASASADPCWFPVDDPGWYGQSIVPAAGGPSAGTDRFVDRGRAYRRVRAVTIDELIDARSRVDYLHMDIQGTEYDFLAKNPARLSQTVRVANVGTHSAAIERRLRALFRAEGWDPLHDVPMGSEAELFIDDALAGRVTFGDGVQVWENPRLREAMPSPAVSW